VPDELLRIYHLIKLGLPQWANNEYHKNTLIDVSIRYWRKTKSPYNSVKLCEKGPYTLADWTTHSLFRLLYRVQIVRVGGREKKPVPNSLCEDPSWMATRGISRDQTPLLALLSLVR
jgi:hypothetical protein